MAHHLKNILDRISTCASIMEPSLQEEEKLPSFLPQAERSFRF